MLEKKVVGHPSCPLFVVLKTKDEEFQYKRM
jgi:hypothetical protein